MLHRALIGLLTSALLLLAASPGQSKVRVVSTIPDFGAIAQEVGGKCVDVSSLVKATQDPHYVDAKPSLMLKLNKAHLLLLTGMELEAGWLPALLTGARNARIQKGGSGYLDCSTLVEPMNVQAPDRSKGDIHPGGNPHFWTDPRNGEHLARGITARLEQIDPSGQCDYRANLARFLERLNRKIREWNAQLFPLRGSKVVVYHESWTYFLDWIGFVQVGALEPKPGIPPKPSHVAALIQKVRDEHIKLVIQESYYPTRLSKIFAEKSGAQLKVLPTMVGAGGTKNYIDLIDHLVREITNSTKGPLK